VEFVPTPEQRSVIYDSIDAGGSALVVAGPGTGKSRTAIEAARRKIASLADNSRAQVLFLSFSNAAIQRLVAAAGVVFSNEERSRLRFLTYHSLAADILRAYGRFCGLPPKVRVADKLEERLLALERDWPSEESGVENAVLGLARSEGILTFDVLIPLATALVAGSTTLATIIGRRYPLLIADEFQDTSAGQWRLLQVVGTNSQVLAFGDPNQIIYSSMHAATAARLAEFARWKGVNATPFSDTNFRCGIPSILEFANCLLNGKKLASGKHSGVQLIDAKYRNQLRACLATIWKNIYTKVGPKQTIAFLAPANDLVEQIAVELRSPPVGSPIPFPVYAQMARDEAACDAVLLALAALRDLAMNQSQNHTKRAAIALLAMNSMWNRKFKIGTTALAAMTEILDAARKGDGSPMASLIANLGTGLTPTTQIPLLLNALGSRKEFQKAVSRISAHGRLPLEMAASPGGQLSLFDFCRTSRVPKGLSGDDAWAGKTHVLTYHKAKGREFDYVVMVVEPRCEASKPPLDEKRRLYYVCATRAKKWLGVIHFGKDRGPVLGAVV
jgi:DNA helicase-2/ATP-dependent DNA helicase PcrA